MNIVSQKIPRNQAKFKEKLKNLPKSVIESLDVIASFYFRYGKTRFSQKFIANKKGYVRETINRAIAVLVENGLIIKHEQKRKMPGYICSYELPDWLTKDMFKSLQKIFVSFRSYPLKFLCSRTLQWINNKKVTLVNYLYNYIYYKKNGDGGCMVINKSLYVEKNVAIQDLDREVYHSTTNTTEIEEIYEKRLKHRDKSKKIWYSWEIESLKNNNKGKKFMNDYTVLETPAIKKVCEKYKISMAGKTSLRALSDDYIYELLERLEEHPEIVNPVAYMLNCADEEDVKQNWHRAFTLKEAHGVDKKDYRYMEFDKNKPSSNKKIINSECMDFYGKESKKRIDRDEDRSKMRAQQLAAEEKNPMIVVENFEKIINSDSFKKLKFIGWSETMYAKGMIIPLILEGKLPSRVIDYLFTKYPFLIEPTSEAYNEKKTSEQCKKEAAEELTQRAICDTNQRPQRKDDYMNNPF